MGIITTLTSVILLFTFLLNLSHISFHILHYSVPKNLELSFLQWKFQDMHCYSVCCFFIQHCWCVIFLRNFWQHFSHDNYVTKVLVMNKLCSTENISLMQMSSPAQETLPNLVRESICIIPYLLESKTRFFPEIWCLNMWGCLKFMYPVPKWTAPNRIALNRTIRNKPRPALPSSFQLTPVHSCNILQKMQMHTYKTVCIDISIKISVTKPAKKHL